MKADYGSLKRHMWAMPLEAIMLFTAGLMIAQGNWLHLSTSLFTFTVSFAPLLFEKIVRVRLPAVLQFSYVAFIFSSMFLGEVFHFYSKIWEWDDVMHFLSGILIALITVLWLFTLTKQLKSVKIPAWLQVLFVHGMVAAVIVAWELVEFASDQLFGTNTQGGDLIDTMSDLAWGTLGGVFVCILLASHLLGKKIYTISRMIDSYSSINK